MQDENENNQGLAKTDSSLDPEVVDIEEEPNKIRAVHQQVRISGPLPSASEMALYAQIDPNFAHRIIAMAETEASHRHEMDKTLVEKESGDIKRGQNYALIIGLAGLSVATYAIQLDRPWIAALLGGGSLVMLVTAFIKGRQQ